MARVTAIEVRAILPTETLLTDPQITEAIEAATCVIDSLESTLSAACIKIMEKYLSAHFSCVTEFTLSLVSEKDGCSGGQVVYGFELGTGIMGSRFGQMANTVSGGELAEIDKSVSAIHSIGCL